MSGPRRQRCIKQFFVKKTTAALQAATESLLWVCLALYIPQEHIPGYFQAGILHWKGSMRCMQWWAPLRLGTAEVTDAEAWESPPGGAAALRAGTVWHYIEVPPIGLDVWADHVLTNKFCLRRSENNACDVCHGCFTPNMRMWHSTRFYTRTPFRASCWRSFILKECGIATSLHSALLAQDPEACVCP